MVIYHYMWRRNFILRNVQRKKWRKRGLCLAKTTISDTPFTLFQKNVKCYLFFTGRKTSNKSLQPDIASTVLRKWKGDLRHAWARLSYHCLLITITILKIVALYFIHSSLSKRIPFVEYENIECLANEHSWMLKTWVAVLNRLRVLMYSFPLVTMKLFIRCICKAQDQARVGRKYDFTRKVANSFSFTYVKRLTPKYCNEPGVMANPLRCQYGTHDRGREWRNK